MQAIAVFCGSSEGRNPAYRHAAREIGRLLAKKKITLVYGGGRVGLMGAVADSCLENDGQVIGVIPRFLSERELAHHEVSKLHIVNDMHERKRLMSDLAHGFITLPGGLGTFEEMFEILTWSQLGVHRKPMGLLNVEGYYDPMVRLLEHSVEEGFVACKDQALLIDASEPSALLAKMAKFRPKSNPEGVDNTQL